MPSVTRATASAARPVTRGSGAADPELQSAKTTEPKVEDIEVKENSTSPRQPSTNSRKRPKTTAGEGHGQRNKKIKAETRDSLQAIPDAKPATASPRKPTDLQSKKLKSFTRFAKQTPFPEFPRPTPSEAKLAHNILSRLHGARTRPDKVVADPTRAGCGDSPSVLDALVRTILSQNTSDVNSTRAKRNMDKVYGRSDDWEAIVDGGQAKLQEAIKSGGLSVVKSKVIISILHQVKEKYGEYSLDHLHNASSEDAMTEMLSFQGVGPKTASCVLLFCLQRESFAVDTHVWRITGLLGWRPKSASRDETYAHLDVRIPDEDKYGLHILFVKHGKVCDECKAGGRNVGKCELRKAFGKKIKEEDVKEEMKEEEEEILKGEDSDTE